MFKVMSYKQIVPFWRCEIDSRFSICQTGTSKQTFLQTLEARVNHAPVLEELRATASEFIPHTALVCCQGHGRVCSEDTERHCLDLVLEAE